MVWNIVAMNYGQGRFIECQWQGTPYYQKATQRRNTLQRSEKPSVRYRHRLRECNPPLATLSVCTESREETLRCNPNYLQLNRGSKIYFNAERDTIYFDLRDMFMMYEYCTDKMKRLGYLNVHGFDEILHLANPRPHTYHCIQDLIADGTVGPLMPNVRDVEYRPRQGRVTNLWTLDYHLGRLYDDLMETLDDPRQVSKVDDFRCEKTILSYFLFHRI